MSNNSQIPNFFIIGAPKCGTTSLSVYLGQHPNIFFCPTKEPQYFANDFENRRISSIKHYMSLFSSVDSNNHQAIGEGSTNYFFSETAVQNILKFNPDAKFIVMLRNPVELVYSFHSQMVYQGMEDILDFELAWKAQQNRQKGINLPSNIKDRKWLMYSDWGTLGKQLERLYRIVPRDRVMVIIFDDFISETKKKYEDALKFLNIPFDNRKNFSAVNKSKQVRSHILQNYLTYLEGLCSPFRKRFFSDKGFGLYTFLLQINSKTTQKIPLSIELKSELNNIFLEDILKLSELLERDLSYWVHHEI